MTQQEQEAYVRARWKIVDIQKPFAEQKNIRYWVNIAGTGCIKICEIEAAAWQAAYDFTVAREEEIRLLEEGIAEIEDDLSCYANAGSERLNVVYSGILARLQQALEDLTKGMVKA